ncbi:MAG: hypothetical protein IKJ99_08435 [Oscillospiraceae bacterium]|nr:hypothetical protein [Oscillospiraceae bacterium]
MKKLLSLILILSLCAGLSGCVLSIPTEFPDLKIESTTSDTVCYPLQMTVQNPATGVTTVSKYEYNSDKGFTGLNLPVVVTVFEDNVQVDSYEVEFDEFASLIRIRDTEIENTYDDENRLIRSIYTENGEVTKIIKREYDENGHLASEAVCDKDEVVISFDLYTFEGEYGSYASVDHHDADARCFGSSELTYNATGWPNQQVKFDLDGHILATTTWQYFTHSNTVTVIG